MWFKRRRTAQTSRRGSRRRLAADRLEQRICLSPPPVYYDYTVIAKTGDQGLTGLGTGPSINDNGQVAFVGQFADGSDSIFVGDRLSTLNNVSKALQSPNRYFQPSVQINCTFPER